MKKLVGGGGGKKKKTNDFLLVTGKKATDFKGDCRGFQGQAEGTIRGRHAWERKRRGLIAPSLFLEVPLFGGHRNSKKVEKGGLIADTKKSRNAPHTVFLATAGRSF